MHPRERSGALEAPDKRGSMNKRLSIGMLLPALGWIPLLGSGCGGQEQPPPAEPSGYQAPTAEPGTDQGIGNMNSDVESTEPTDSPDGGMEAAPNAPPAGPNPDQGTTGATPMGSGGMGATANASATATTSRTTGTTGSLR